MTNPEISGAAPNHQIIEHFPGSVVQRRTERYTEEQIATFPINPERIPNNTPQIVFNSSHAQDLMAISGLVNRDEDLVPVVYKSPYYEYQIKKKNGLKNKLTRKPYVEFLVLTPENLIRSASENIFNLALLTYFICTQLHSTYIEVRGKLTEILFDLEKKTTTTVTITTSELSELVNILEYFRESILFVMHQTEAATEYYQRIQEIAKNNLWDSRTPSHTTFELPPKNHPIQGHAIPRNQSVKDTLDELATIINDRSNAFATLWSQYNNCGEKLRNISIRDPDPDPENPIS